MDLDNVRFLLDEKGYHVSLDKQKKVFDAIQSNIETINKAFKAAGLPHTATLQSVDMIENDISWNFSYVISENQFIN